MGELQDYYIIRSIVKYNDDPLKIGRIKCNIPGVLNSEVTQKEAMPWIRPFKMYGYQTFCFPEIDQIVWVLISKTNYNEFWWFPFCETIDLVQNYLNEHYDDQPDVFHARNSSKKVLSTFDSSQGYNTKIGEDYVNLGLNSKMTCAFGGGRLVIDNSNVYCGGGDPPGGYEPTIMGDKFQSVISTIKQAFDQLADVSFPDPHTSPLSPLFKQISTALEKDIYTKNCKVN